MTLGPVGVRRLGLLLGLPLQLVPVLLLTIFLTANSMPHTPGRPLVTPRLDAWIFPFSIVLGLAGVAAIWFQTAASATALLTAVAMTYGILGISSTGFEESVTSPVATLGSISLIGWALRAVAGRDERATLGPLTATAVALSVLGLLCVLFFYLTALTT